jgi:hypothetical protein
MLYKVKAKMREGKMEAFFTALTDGSIAAQEPDGPTIVNAMQKALMIDEHSPGMKYVIVIHLWHMNEKQFMIHTFIILLLHRSIKSKPI